MKKIILICLALISGVIAFSQAPIIPRSTTGTNTILDSSLFIGKSFRVPVFSDTTAANNHPHILDSAGKIIFTTSDNSFWGRKDNPKRWDALGGLSGVDPYDSILQGADSTFIIFQKVSGIQDTVRLITITPTYTQATLTDAPTIIWDVDSVGNEAAVTIAGNRTLSIINLPAGHVLYLTLVVKQDATGSRTLTWPTIKWINGIAPVLTTAGNGIDIITLRWSGATLYGTYGNDYK